MTEQEQKIDEAFPTIVPTNNAPLPIMVQKVPAEQYRTIEKEFGKLLTHKKNMRTMLHKWIKSQFKIGIHYGQFTIEVGDKTYETKHALLKPGSELLLDLFEWEANFEPDFDTWKMLGEPRNVVCYKCILRRKSTKQFVAEGRGTSLTKDSSNNNAVKKAEKRAQIDAVLRATELSGEFTQDLEDEQVAGSINDAGAAVKEIAAMKIFMQDLHKGEYPKDKPGVDERFERAHKALTKFKDDKAVMKVYGELQELLKKRFPGQYGE